MRRHVHAPIRMHVMGGVQARSTTTRHTRPGTRRSGDGTSRGGADVGPDQIDDLLERQPPSWRVVRSLWLVVILGGIGLFS